MYRFCLKKQPTCRDKGLIRSSEELFGTGARAGRMPWGGKV